MSIEKIKTNFEGVSTPKKIKRGYVSSQRAYLSQEKDSVSFTGAPLKVSALEDVTKLVKEKLPKTPAMDGVKSWVKGELGGILITGLGTGAVAPFSIAFNPFVKAPENATPEQKEEVENTKKYSALRQPISAIIAVLFQAGVQKPIDKFLETITNDARYSQELFLGLDQSALNKKEYLQRIIKNQWKAGGTDFTSDDLKAIAKVRNTTTETLESLHNGNKLTKEELEAVTKVRTEKQEKALLDVLVNEGKITIGNRSFSDEEVGKLFNRLVDNYANTTRSLKIGEKGLDYYCERAELLMKPENRSEIEKIFASDIMDTFAQKPAELEQYLKKCASDTQNSEVKNIINEIINKHAPKYRESRCRRTLERIQKIDTACEKNYATEIYRKSMVESNKELDGLAELVESLKFKNGEEITAQLIKERLAKLKEHCNISKASKKLKDVLDGNLVFLTNKKDVAENVEKDFLKIFKNKIATNYKAFNQISKVAVGVLITLPISCTVLNWAYPRIMDIFFPKLAGKPEPTKEENNGGNK